MPFSLSVGIPATDDAKDLQTRLEAALTQDQPFAEVLVGGHSAAGAAAEVLEQFADRVHVLPPQEQAMPAVEVWDLLGGQMTGEWITILPPGNIPQPSYCRAIEEAHSASSRAVLVRAGHRRLRPGNSAPELHTLYSVRSVTHPAEALYEQRFGPKGSLAAFALKRSAWQTLGGFPGKGERVDEWAMWLLAGAQGDTVRSREVIAEMAAPPVTRRDTAHKVVEIAEMYGIFRDVLPRAAETAGLGRPLWIEAASRKRFRDVVIACSLEFDAHTRASLVTALLPWAREVQQLALLKRLERGDRIRSFSPGRQIKPVLKRVISAVR